MFKPKQIISIIIILLQVPVIGHTFPIKKWADKCLALYNQLVQLEYPEPMHEYFTKPSERAFNKESFKILFDEAERTGLEAQYQNIIKGNAHRDLLKSFISAQHFLMMAFMQGAYGNKEPFRFEGYQDAKNDANDPVIGYYINDNLIKTPITRYSFFNGLMGSLYRVNVQELTDNERNELARKVLRIHKELKIALKIAKNDLHQDKIKRSVKECLLLYNELVNINYPKPTHGTLTVASRNAYKEKDYRSLFDEALNTGLQQQYLHLITGAIKKDLLESFLSANHLVVVANMQREPEKYLENNNKTAKATNPKLGEYVLANTQRIEITRYSFLYALIKFCETSRNQLMTSEHIQYRESMLEKLKKNLEEAKKTAKILSKLDHVRARESNLNEELLFALEGKKVPNH